jgi:predicted phage tail protein
MNLLSRIFIGVLILSFLGLYFPNAVLAGQGQLYAKADKTTAVTKHTPEVLAPPEENIPVEKVAKEKTNKWLWGLVGAALVAGLAAGGGGGGGGGGGSDTGGISVSW